MVWLNGSVLVYEISGCGVRISLLSLKLQTWRLLRARRFLTFRQTIECRFTLKLVRDMIITYSQFSSYRKIDDNIEKILHHL